MKNIAKWVGRCFLILVGMMYLRNALNYNDSIPMRMWYIWYDPIYIRAHVLSKLIDAYLACICFWSIFHFRQQVLKACFVCYWQVLILLCFVFPLLTIDCYWRHLEPAVRWISLVCDIPFVIWSIIGLWQVIRKVEFTRAVWRVHIIFFILYPVWGILSYSSFAYHYIDDWIIKLGQYLGVLY